MRAVALLLLTGLHAVAAPVPKLPAKPGVEVTLSAQNQLVLEVTIQNHGKEPLELPYRVSPLEHVAITLQGEQGKTVTVPTFGEAHPNALPGTLTLPAGESKTLTLETCHFLPELGEPGQKVTFTAQFKHGDKRYDAKPLTVDR